MKINFKAMSVGIALLFTSGWVAANAPVDEVIATQGDWQARVVANDAIWGLPTCVAMTLAPDGVSSLEVIAFYDEESGQFSEPTVHIMTPFDVSFLSVEARMDNQSSARFRLLPVLLPQEVNSEVPMVGARALYDERESLTQALRRRNFVSVRYADSGGEVRSLRFSLRGSNATIGALFEKCQLQFRPLELGALKAEALQ